jgi:hypothetical protein
MVWSRRLLPLRAVAVAFVLAAVAITELRLDWIETIVGGYMVSTNTSRPKSGAIWEQGEQAASARQTLAEYADQRQNVLREAQQAQSLGQVMGTIIEGKGVMISAEHFLELYLKLPPAIAHEIVSPYDLLTHTSAGRWQRTFIDRQEQQVLIFMLDAQNQVVYRLTIGSVLLAHIERGEVAIRSGLEQLSDFAAHIYPAERFFELLNSYPQPLREQIVAHPEELLRITGKIRRVGISSSAMGDAVDLGFEVEDVAGYKVLLMQGQREAVQQIQSDLDGTPRFQWPWTGGGQP